MHILTILDVKSAIKPWHIMYHSMWGSTILTSPSWASRSGDTYAQMSPGYIYNAKFHHSINMLTQLIAHNLNGLIMLVLLLIILGYLGQLVYEVKSPNQNRLHG